MNVNMPKTLSKDATLTQQFTNLSSISTYEVLIACCAVYCEGPPGTDVQFVAQTHILQRVYKGSVVSGNMIFKQFMGPLLLLARWQFSGIQLNRLRVCLDTSALALWESLNKLHPASIALRRLCVPNNSCRRWRDRATKLLKRRKSFIILCSMCLGSMVR